MQLLEKKYQSRTSDVKAMRNMLYIVSEVRLHTQYDGGPCRGTTSLRRKRGECL